MSNLSSIAVFCGSASGNHPSYRVAALQLCQQLSANKIDLVYGGGSIGLMGVIANEMLALKREVVGVIPKKIYDWEVGHDGLTRLEVVENMHIRKARMAELADGFIALPGGVGTLEEIIEAITWQQLGYHQKPCGFLNVNGYFDKLLDFIEHMKIEGFFREEHANSILVASDPDELLRKMKDSIQK
jgi:hypothetical protein